MAKHITPCVHCGKPVEVESVDERDLNEAIVKHTQPLHEEIKGIKASIEAKKEAPEVVKELEDWKTGKTHLQWTDERLDAEVKGGCPGCKKGIETFYVKSRDAEVATSGCLEGWENCPIKGPVLKAYNDKKFQERVKAEGLVKPEPEPEPPKEKKRGYDR